jgi:hypothetical protein
MSCFEDGAVPSLETLTAFPQLIHWLACIFKNFLKVSRTDLMTLSVKGEHHEL